MNMESQMLAPFPVPARFEGQVVIVTGAAAGIGKACALRFAQEGANVACLDVQDAANGSTAHECRVIGVGAVALHCDVTDPSQVRTAVVRTLDSWGKVDVLVAAAGIYTGGLLEEVTLAQWQRTLQVNLTGVFLCAQAVAPTMRQRGRGSVIAISSMSGKTSWPGTHEYSASKSGVIGLVRSMAMELAPHGVTVNAICPGNTYTDLLIGVARQLSAREGITPEAWLDRRAKDCPMQRFAHTWEIAGVAAFLASPDARFITGQAIEVDGGMVMS